MSRRDRDSQLPLTMTDINDARAAAAAIIHHTPLSNAVRKDLEKRRRQLGKVGYWKQFSLRSASAGKRHRTRAKKTMYKKINIIFIYNI